MTTLFDLCGKKIRSSVLKHFINIEFKYIFCPPTSRQNNGTRKPSSFKIFRQLFAIIEKPSNRTNTRREIINLFFSGGKQSTFFSSCTNMAKRVETLNFSISFKSCACHGDNIVIFFFCTRRLSEIALRSFCFFFFIYTPVTKVLFFGVLEFAFKTHLVAV